MQNNRRKPHFSWNHFESVMKGKWTQAGGQIRWQEEWKLEFYFGPSIKPVLSKCSLMLSDWGKSAWTSTPVVFTYRFSLYARFGHSTTHANKHQSDNIKVHKMLETRFSTRKSKGSGKLCSLRILPPPKIFSHLLQEKN